MCKQFVIPSYSKYSSDAPGCSKNGLDVELTVSGFNNMLHEKSLVFPYQLKLSYEFGEEFVSAYATFKGLLSHEGRLVLF